LRIGSVGGLSGSVAVMLLGMIVGSGCTGPAESPGVLPTPLPPQAGCSVAANVDSLCIIVLGDSIAAGTPLTGADRWWVRLRELLTSALPNRSVGVESWAVPGSRVDVLESAARDQPALGSYDVAIVIEGVNDEIDTPIDVWRPRYERAIEAIEASGPMVIVGTAPPSFENGNFATRYEPTATALREVAAGRRAILDVAARWHADGAAVASSYYSDLIHQNIVGQRLMAQMARDAVLDVIGRH
jgi:lysophospholipase L1-like esterase